MSSVRAGAKIPVGEQKTSRFVESQLPSFLVDMESMIVPFLKAYYEWMDQVGGTVYDIRRLLDLQDVDKTTVEFTQFFMEEFLPGIPRDVLADKKLLLKHAKEIHSSKGSEESFKFLFKILYNEEVDIYYPKEDIFRSSDALWIIDNVIKVAAISETIGNVASRKVFGVESGATAIVDRVITSISNSTPYASLYVTSVNGNFLIDEAIETRDVLPYEVMRCVGQVGSVSIDSPGTGYTIGQIIPISDMGDGSDFTAIVSTVGINGEIKKVSIIDSGVFYYTTPPTPDLSTLTGVGASISFGVGALYKSDGRFVDDRCMPSSTKRLQDGKLYQEYSYVLKSGVSIKIFKDAVLRMIHPAGFFMGSLMVALGNAGLPINVGVYNLHDVNFDDPDHPSNRMFIDVTVRREYSPDEVWSVEKIDSFYPYGIPSGKTFERIFSPELLDPLHMESTYGVRAESRIPLISELSAYVDYGYVDIGYFIVNSYPAIAESRVFVNGPIGSILLEDGFTILLENGYNLILE